jgi:hypothetical protein
LALFTVAALLVLQATVVRSNPLPMMIEVISFFMAIYLDLDDFLNYKC